MLEKAKEYLEKICGTIGERPVGSRANQLTADFLEGEFSRLGWRINSLTFKAMDWRTGGASLMVGNRSFEVYSSPYSLGAQVEGELAGASTVEELQALNLKDKILFLHGEIAKEPLMPKNFVFYNPDEHKKILSLLEEKSPLGIVTVTTYSPLLAGGVYPFPMIEDGDFHIPSVYMTEEEGRKLLMRTGEKARLDSEAERIPSLGKNVSARGGNPGGKSIVITAHLDTKIGTPGAIDNGTGLIVLLLLAELLKDYQGPHSLELMAFNGEDYYAVPGQMAYIASMGGDFKKILLNINIDGAGYKEGPSAFSIFEIPTSMADTLTEVMDSEPNLIKGIPWYQGDHSIFLQSGVPAIAITSKWFLDNGDTQTVTHTPKDKPEIVAPERLVEIAEALKKFLFALG